MSNLVMLADRRWPSPANFRLIWNSPWTGVNGHEWLARKLKENGIRYTKQENAFLWIEDMARAQAFSDRFASLE